MKLHRRSRHRLPVFLVLLVLFLSACVRPDPDVPTRVIPTPTPVPENTQPPPADTPEYGPFETIEPPSSDGSESLSQTTPEPPAEYRVVFLIDNSQTPMTTCPAIPEEPKDSQAREAMRGIVSFMTNILAAVNGPARGDLVEIGIYTTHAEEDEHATTLAPWTILPLDKVHRLEDELEWADDLTDALEAEGLDKGGLAPIIRTLRQHEVLDNSHEQIVILITDGFTGNYVLDAEVIRLREEFKAELEQLYEEQKTTFHVLRFDCPGLIPETGQQDDRRLYNIYDMDLERWNSLAGLQLINQIVVPLPSRPHQQNALSLTAPLLFQERTYTSAAVALLQHDSLAPLLPQGTPGASGWGWIHEGDSESQNLELPGDTGVLKLWAVRSTNSAGFKARIEREGDSVSYNLGAGDYANTFILDEYDPTLDKILEAETEDCGPITWWLEGNNRLAFYWYEFGPVEYSLAGTETAPTTTNNGPIDIDLDVRKKNNEGHKDCFTVRVSLHAGKQHPTLLASRELTLRELEEEDNLIILDGGYAYNPVNDGRLRVTVELIRNLNMMTNRSLDRVAEIREQVAAWSKEVGVVYEPQLHDKNGVRCNDAGCEVSVGFDFATQPYHDSQEPDVQVFLLSTLDASKIASSDGNDDRNEDATRSTGFDCGGFVADEDDFHLISSVNGYRSGFELGLLDEDNMPWWEVIIDIDFGQKRVQTSFITSDKIEACGYSGVLIQWRDHPRDWQAILCDLKDNDGEACDATPMRVRTESDD